MKYGIYLSNFGEFASPQNLSDLAHGAEIAGWDGFFLWDHILYEEDIQFTDPWIALAAIAVSTKTIKLGPLVTPLPRRRPWILARESVTMDHLSNGRFIQGVGIGGDWWNEYSSLGESSDDKLHSEMLDEGLSVLSGLWSGKAVHFDGRHYQIKNVCFLPPPLQTPRIPIWVAGYWPHKVSFRRAAKWDGIFPYKSEGNISPQEIGSICDYIAQFRDPALNPIDVIIDTAMAIDQSAATIAEYQKAGVSWWLECFDQRHSSRDIQECIKKGPPKLQQKRKSIRKH